MLPKPSLFSGSGKKRLGCLRGPLESLLRLLPPKVEILPPSTGCMEFAPPGLLLHVSCLCCVDGNFRNMPPSRRGRKKLLRNLQTRLKLQCRVGWGRLAGASLAAPGAELDSTKECGIPGILLNWLGPTKSEGGGLFLPGEPLPPNLLPLQQQSQGFGSATRWWITTSSLKHAIK